MAIHVTVDTTIVGTFTNTATVATTTPEPPGGGNPNGAQADVTVRPVADLTLAKSAPATVAAGGALTWELTVTNHGPSDATGVTISDPLPAGTTFRTADPGCSAASGVVACAVGTLANGASATRHVTVTVPHALGGTTVLNTATVHSAQGDDDPSNDSATATTQGGPSANLAIVKTGPASVEAAGTVAWTLAVSNAGPSTATGVRVVDALPPGVALVSTTPTQGSCTAAGGTVDCSLGALASGAAAQIQVVAHVPAALEGASLSNRASVSGEQPDPSPVDDSSTITTRVGPPLRTDFDLALVKEVAGPAEPEPGTALRYTLTVTNAGPATATAVKLVDTLPSSVDYVSATWPGGTCGERAGVVTCTLPALAPGATARATVTVRPLRSGALRNTASVSSAVADRDPGNDRSTATVRLDEKPAVLRIAKTAMTRRAVPAGGRVQLKIRVTNTSRYAATDVVVCDDLGSTTTYVKATKARFRDGRACWTIGVLPAGASRTFSVVVRVNRRMSPGTLRSGASVKAGNARTKRHAAKIRVKQGAAGRREAAVSSARARGGPQPAGRRRHPRPPGLSRLAFGALIAATAAIGASAPAGAAESGRDEVRGPTARRAWTARVVVPTAVRARPDMSARRTGRVGTVAAWNGGNVRLLVLAARNDARGRRWIKVRLPERPNTRAGWMRADFARLTAVRWRFVIDLRARRARAYHDGHLKRSWRVVVGKRATPTPRGRFAIYERVRQPAGSELGPYALHLTAHSQTLFDYGGGPGRIALHGRDGALLRDPLGSAASHGCVRMDNRVLRWLAPRATPGTPVEIR